MADEPKAKDRKELLEEILNVDALVEETEQTGPNKVADYRKETGEAVTVVQLLGKTCQAIAEIACINALMMTRMMSYV